MEFSGKLDLGLDFLSLASECHLGKLDTELVLAGLFSIVLILHIRVHIAIEKLGVVLISQLESHTLIRCASLSD